MNNRTCYWSPQYQPGKQLVLSEVDNSKYINIDDIAYERKQKAWSYIRKEMPELASLMRNKEFNKFKKQMNNVFNAKQVIEI